jgi:hypothetical protein
MSFFFSSSFLLHLFHSVNPPKIIQPSLLVLVVVVMVVAVPSIHPSPSIIIKVTIRECVLLPISLEAEAKKKQGGVSGGGLGYIFCSVFVVLEKASALKKRGGSGGDRNENIIKAEEARSQKTKNKKNKAGTNKNLLLFIFLVIVVMSDKNKSGRFVVVTAVHRKTLSGPTDFVWEQDKREMTRLRNTQ